MRITSKGQVTIPITIRERAGLMPNTEVEFVMDGNIVKIVKAKKSKKPTRGQSWIERMKGRATTKLSTDEIMRLTRDW